MLKYLIKYKNNLPAIILKVYIFDFYLIISYIKLYIILSYVATILYKHAQTHPNDTIELAY
jgi:hypothetical protein